MNVLLLFYQHYHRFESQEVRNVMLQLPTLADNVVRVFEMPLVNKTLLTLREFHMLEPATIRDNQFVEVLILKFVGIF